MPDSAAILLGIIAVTIRERVGPTSQAPTHVAAVNATVLLGVTMFVLVAAVGRLLHGTPVIYGLPVLIVSGLATGVMVAGVFVLGFEARSEDRHMRSVLLDTASDARASAAVAIGGAVIHVTGQYYWLDSALSLAIGLIIGLGALRLLGSVAVALRRGAPLDIDDDYTSTDD